MPQIWPVLSQAFTKLFSRLGIQAFPAGPQWWLSDTIIPVTIVDAEISLTTIVSPPIYTTATEGQQTAPGNGTLLATSGPLPAGNYTFLFLVSSEDSNVIGGMNLQHRDAADAANLWTHLIVLSGDGSQDQQIGPIQLALLDNERVRINSQGTVAAGRVVQGSIFFARL